MNYIVFDLEWNHPTVELNEPEPKLPFEIIEIGAVKLDEDMNFVSGFSELIKPQVYTEINTIIHDIINIDTKDLKKKEPFQEVIHKFFKWCGEDYIFCTWGSMDLTELERNMDYFNISEYLNGPVKYLDVQKLFALQYIGRKDMQSLENVTDYFELKKNKQFHRAYADATYTAEILRRLDKNFVNSYYSIDSYHNPKNKEDAILVVYDTYSKYISAEYPSREEAMKDSDISDIICFKCGKKAHTMINWFSSNPKTITAVASCRDHGLLKGRMKVKRTESGNIFLTKIVKPINHEEYENINSRQQLIRARRREKRLRKKMDIR